MPPRKKTDPAEVVIKRLDRKVAAIPINGTAPLICNRFSQKAKQMMLDKQMGRSSVREVKNPEALYEASLYPLPPSSSSDRLDRYGFPAPGFKAAIVDAARYFKGSLTMVSLRPTIYVHGETSDLLVPIDGVPKMREDAVRNTTGVADLRFRGEFWPWSAVLHIKYLPSILQLDSLVSLVDASGLGGIGEMRPNSKKSNSGIYGTYEVPQDAKVVTL